MKKKFPKPWVQAILEMCVDNYNMGKKGESFPKIGFAEGELYGNHLLSSLDTAGMLREVPALLEVEYCTKHGARAQTQKYVVGHNVCLVLAESAIYPGCCTFVKLRQVDEE